MNGVRVNFYLNFDLIEGCESVNGVRVGNEDEDEDDEQWFSFYFFLF